MFLNDYTLQKHLGYFNHTFKSSQLHQCDQGMLPNTFSRKFIEELLFLVALAQLLSEDRFGYNLGITTTTKEFSRGRYTRSKKKKSPEVLDL